jgi:hypothetical protein
MERYCSTGQSPQQAVVPTEEEEEELLFSLIPVNVLVDGARVGIQILVHDIWKSII